MFKRHRGQMRRYFQWETGYERKRAMKAECIRQKKHKHTHVHADKWHFQHFEFSIEIRRRRRI